MENPDRPTLLRWVLQPDGAQVFRQDERILHLTGHPGGSERFTLNGCSYTLQRHGGARLRTTIHRDGTAVAHVRASGPFRPHRIELVDEAAYTAAWSNAPLAKLAVRDAGGRDVLTLRLATEGGVHTETVLAAGMPLDERTLLLLALAYTLFGGAMREKGHATLPSVT